MGICYSQEQQWDICEQNYRKKRKNRRRNNYFSVVVEQNTIHESFAPKVESSFREDLHNTLINIASELGTLTFGSVVEMSESELETLEKSLEKINPGGDPFDSNEYITFCNLKTKNYLHTHKIKHPCNKKCNEVSACPSNASHFIEYDLWKMVPAEDEAKCQIYHPLTQSFLAVYSGKVVASEQKYDWKIQDFGPRRNGGFIKFIAQTSEGELELCMTDEAGILGGHRKLELCREKHISHLWEVKFGECEVEQPKF